MELTKKSQAHLEFMCTRYKDLFPYRVSDHYFMKLLYVLLSKAEECTAQLTIHHASDVRVSNTYLSGEPMDHYVVEMRVHDVRFDINIYTQEPLGRMLHLIQLALSLCAREAPLDHYRFTFYLTLSQDPHLEGNHAIVFGQEWFQVFLQICVRLFCLELEEVDSKQLLQPMFRVESTYSLEDAFCEFWAKTLNVAIFSYWNHSYEEFERYFEIHLTLERSYSLVQMKHYLSHFNLSYKVMIHPDHTSSMPGFNHVLSAILFFHFQQTMNWFVDHNETNLHFTKKARHIHLFCHYLNSIYAQDKFLKQIEAIQDYPESWAMSIFEMR